MKLYRVYFDGLARDQKLEQTIQSMLISDPNSFVKPKMLDGLYLMDKDGRFSYGDVIEGTEQTLKLTGIQHDDKHLPILVNLLYNDNYVLEDGEHFFLSSGEFTLYGFLLATKIDNYTVVDVELVKDLLNYADDLALEVDLTPIIYDPDPDIVNQMIQSEPIDFEKEYGYIPLQYIKIPNGLHEYVQGKYGFIQITFEKYFDDLTLNDRVEIVAELIVTNEPKLKEYEPKYYWKSPLQSQ